MALRSICVRVSVLLCLLFTIPELDAQLAQVSGIVTDAQGAVVPNAQIEIESAATQSKVVLRTNGAGLYVVPALQPGSYRISVTAAGFETRIIDGVVINVGSKASLNVSLKTGSTSESVTVDGAGLQINTTDASVSTVIDRQFVENMPLNGRSFQSLMTIIPGVTVVPSIGVGAGGEISVNGQRTEANYFTVDGVSANTGASPTANGTEAGFAGGTAGESSLGTTQTMASIEALQEFRATTSTYSAQYGRTPGGQFEFSTRSGENRFHGALFEYFRNDAMDANRWFNKYLGQPKAALRQNDFGGTVGGPVFVPRLYSGRDKSFFFFAYEGLQLRAPQPAVSLDVPNIYLRNNAPAAIRPMLNAFPVQDDPNDTALGNGLARSTASYSNPSTLHTSSLRLDHSITDRAKVFVRFAYTPNSTLSRSYNATSSNLAIVTGTKNLVKSVTLGSTNFLSSRLSNEARFNLTGNDTGYQTHSDGFHGASVFTTQGIPGVQENASNWFRFGFQYGLFPTIAIVPIANKQRQINAVDWMTATAGRHTLRWGVDYRRTITSLFLPPFCEYGYYYNVNQVMTNTAQVVTTFKFSSNAKPIYQNFSAYVQDEWKVSPRLNLSAGLRWEVNPAPRDANGNNPYTYTTKDLATMEIAPRNTPLWATTWGNIAPRLGLAWQASQKQDYGTTVRIGAGLFYDTGNILGSLGYNGSGIFGTAQLANVTYPLSAATIATLPSPGVTKPYSTSYVGFDPHLALPYSLGWNLAVEQGLGRNQSITVGYVASVGRQQTKEQFYYPRLSGNMNFTTTSVISLITNGVSSNYNSLQVSWQKRLSHGLQAQASYTWSHSFDNQSNNFQSYSLLYASSDFDIRNNFQSALTYDVPGRYSNIFVSGLLANWSVDSRISARSSLPIDINGGNVVNPATGNFFVIHPNRVPGQPLYVSTPDSSGKLPPGGHRINVAAFQTTTTEGNAGRNIARGFDAVQADVAIRKEFGLVHDKAKLQFRAEAFNILNHPVFGSVYNNLTNGAGRFGYAYTTQDSQLGGLNSIYQVGGPRSLQLALRLHF